MYARACVCLRARMYVRACVCLRVSVRVSVFLAACVCVCARVCVCLCSARVHSALSQDLVEQRDPPKHSSQRPQHQVRDLITTQSGSMFHVGIFLDFVWLTTRTMHPHGAYAQGARRNRIALTAMGVELNGPRCVRRTCRRSRATRCAPPPGLDTKESGKRFRWAFFLVSAAHLHVRPYEAYVQIGGRNRIDHYWGELNGWRRARLGGGVVGQGGAVLDVEALSLAQNGGVGPGDGNDNQRVEQIPTAMGTRAVCV